MKFLRISFAALAAALSLPAVPYVLAQGAQAGVEGQANVQAGSADASAAIADRYLTSVQAQLTSKVDSKSAVVGQELAAKTTQAATLADGAMLPKGTRLVGHVTAVQPLGKDQPYAMLAIVFDHAELKGGQSVALRSVIRGVGPPASLRASDATPMDASAGPMGGMGAGTPAGGRPGMGTNGGPVAPGRPVGPVAGSPLGGVGENAGPGTLPTAGMGGPVAQAGETVTPVPRATGLPGVMLSTANGSGTLTAAGRNIALESGTVITMGVIGR